MEKRERCTYTATNSDQLGWLIMGISQCWHILVLDSKLGELVDDCRKLWEEKIETVTQEDKVRIVLFSELASPSSAEVALAKVSQKLALNGANIQ